MYHHISSPTQQITVQNNHRAHCDVGHWPFTSCQCTCKYYNVL